MPGADNQMILEHFDNEASRPGSPATDDHRSVSAPLNRTNEVEATASPCEAVTDEGALPWRTFAHHGAERDAITDAPGLVDHGTPVFDPPSDKRSADILLWKMGAWVIALFWFIQLCEVTLVSLAEGTTTAISLLAPRAIVVGSGVILSVPIVWVAVRAGRWQFRYRLIATVAVALGSCAAVMGVIYGVTFIPFASGRPPFNAIEFIYSAFLWSWFFLGLAGAVIGLAYSLDVRDRERRLAVMAAVARDAKLAALRYQLNPHFLFNALNSIASLVNARANDTAEAMVVSLSDFLRTTLELDPVDDIPLTREIELQALYLSIEQSRFPERLRTKYNIAVDVRDEPVPALITQPIIENAIRHAVARTMKPVTVTVEAFRVAGRLRIVIRDDSNGEVATSEGTGLGMANVRARLENRFGANHSLDAARTASGYQVEIEIPLRGGR